MSGPDLRGLTIGSIEGGSSPSTPYWDAALTELAQAAAAAADQVGRGSPGDWSLGVLFLVPGHLQRPAHTGVRAGSTFPADRLLTVQVALLEEVRSVAQARRLLARHLADAVAVAEQRGVRRGLFADLAHVRRLLADTLEHAARPSSRP